MIKKGAIIQNNLSESTWTIRYYCNVHEIRFDLTFLVNLGSNKKIIIGHKKHILTDEEQSVEDELAAFEAELAAELGQ